MNLMRSLSGRRQFIIDFLVSGLALTSGIVTKAFGTLFKTGAAKASEMPGTDKRKTIKGIVFYYSATGSTAKIAGAIYRGMKSVIPCDVAPIKKLKPSDIAKYDLVAVGAPNWYHREPVNIKIFTHGMPRMDGKHCVLFCTHGTQPVAIFWSMSKNMIKKGMTIIGWNDWYGDATHVLHAGQPYITHGHPDEIDLAEAETFGRQMAENSIKIYAGEKELIPEIPTPAEGETSNWAPNMDNGEIKHGSPPPNSIPEFDFTKCVYPRCTQCIDNCDLHAIDFSLITHTGLTFYNVSSASPIVLKEACSRCGGVCQRVCLYDAISYAAEKTKHVIDKTKCTYPKCTLCVDECLQDAIDFLKDPPVNYNRCEGCDLCWCICPENAISIPNVAEVHLKKGWWTRKAFAGMTGGGGAMPQPDAKSMTTRMPRFRQLIPTEEIGVNGQVMFNTNAPRVILNKADWPYHIDEEKI